MGSPFVSREQCLLEIARLHRGFGKVTKDVFRQHGSLSYDTVRKRFGSIQKALAELGIEPGAGQRKNTPSDLVADDLRRVFAEHCYISKPLYAKVGRFNSKQIPRIWGSWAAMYTELGFPRSPNGIVATEHELLAELQKLHAEYGLLTADIIKEHGRFSVTTYHERFGSLNAAYEAAGLDTRNPGEAVYAGYILRWVGRWLGEDPIYEHRFDWLRNPATGRHLPVDGYYPKNNLVVEYNGAQHYVVDGLYHQTEEELEYRKNLDEVKYKLIRDHGVKLVVIPWWEGYKNEFLQQKLIAEGLGISA